MVHDNKHNQITHRRSQIMYKAENQLDSMVQLLAGYSHTLPLGPCLVLDDLTKHPTKRTLLPIWNTPFHFTRLKTAHCTGRLDLANQCLRPCPTQATVNQKSTTCYPCSQTQSLHPAFYNLNPDQLSPQQKAHNLTPHLVYLAYFGHHLIKVGMTHENRTYTRWAEQGAQAAVVLQRFPTAYGARELEAYVHTVHQIPERITIQQKQKSLQRMYHFEEASTYIHGIRKQLTTTNPSLRMEEVYNLQTAYFQEKPPYPLYVTTHQGDWPTLAGHGIGLVGEILIYRQQTYHFMQPLKALLGKVHVRLPEEEVPLTTNLQLQLPLWG
eukprot:gene6-8_t